MTDRSYAKNPGYLSLEQIPDDKEIVGAVIVMKDDDNEYSSVFVPADRDELPHEDVREHVGGWVAQSFELAHLGVGQ